MTELRLLDRSLTDSSQSIRSFPIVSSITGAAEVGLCRCQFRSENPNVSGRVPPKKTAVRE